MKSRKNRKNGNNLSRESQTMHHKSSWRIMCLAFPRCFFAMAVFSVFLFSLYPASALPQGAKPEASKLNLFNQAEYLFNVGKFSEAKQYYQEYIEKNPGDSHADQAIFRLGQIDLGNRFYATALGHFIVLLERFPGNPFFSRALFLAGVCHFELEHFKEAGDIFKSQFNSNPDVNVRWESLLYLGRIKEKNSEYDEALAKISEVYNKAENKGLRQQAEQEAERIVNEKLTIPALLTSVQKQRGGFPLDLMLLRLVSWYRVEGDSDNYRSVLQRFGDVFPQHPRRLEAEKMLKQARAVKPGVVKIGVVLPLTGDKAVIGQQVLQGVQLAMSQLSLKERENIEIAVRDSGSALTEVVEELGMDPSVVGILGPVLSNQVQEVAPIAKKYQIPVFTPTASASGLTALNPYIFRNALTKDVQGRYLAQYAMNELNLRRFVIFHPQESYGEELKSVFMDEVRGMGGEIVAVASYDKAQNDFKEQIRGIGGVSDSELKKLGVRHLSQMQTHQGYQGAVPLSKPLAEKTVSEKDGSEEYKFSLALSYDAIFIPGFHDKVGLIVPQLIFYNIDPIVFLGANGWNNPDLVRIAGRYLQNKGIFVDGFFINAKEKQVVDFVKSFKRSFGEDPGILSAQAFDAAQIFLKLIQDGGRNRRQVKARFPSIKDYPGVSGVTTILPTGESEKKLFAMKIKGSKIIQAN